MIKTVLLKIIEKAKDDEDINSLLAGTDIEEEFKGEEPTLDVFKQKIKTDKAFKAFIESENDTHHSKALKTMKEKGTWESEFADVLTQKYPELITDPTQKKLLELQQELAKERANNARKDLLGDATKYALEKKLPVGLVEKFLGDDLDTTKSNLDGLADLWSKDLESAMNEKMKSSSYVPGNGSDGKPISIGASLAAQANKTNTTPSDPWSK